jgi:hypothetical protein
MSTLCQRTGIINQIRAFLLQRGVAVRQGLRFLRTELPGILVTRRDVLSPHVLRLVENLAGDWRHLECVHRRGATKLTLSTTSLLLP